MESRDRKCPKKTIQLATTTQIFDGSRDNIQSNKMTSEKYTLTHISKSKNGKCFEWNGLWVRNVFSSFPNSILWISFFHRKKTIRKKNCAWKSWRNTWKYWIAHNFGSINGTGTVEKRKNWTGKNNNVDVGCFLNGLDASTHLTCFCLGVGWFCASTRRKMMNSHWTSHFVNVKINNVSFISFDFCHISSPLCVPVSLVSCTVYTFSMLLLYGASLSCFITLFHIHIYIDASIYSFLWSEIFFAFAACLSQCSPRFTTQTQTQTPKTETQTNASNICFSYLLLFSLSALKISKTVGTNEEKENETIRLQFSFFRLFHSCCEVAIVVYIY